MYVLNPTMLCLCFSSVVEEILNCIWQLLITGSTEDPYPLPLALSLSLSLSLSFSSGMTHHHQHNLSNIYPTMTVLSGDLGQSRCNVLTMLVSRYNIIRAFIFPQLSAYL